MKKRGKDKLVLVTLILISLFIIFLLAYSKTKITAKAIEGLSIASQTEGEKTLYIKYTDSGSGQESGFSSDVLFVPLSGKINIDVSSVSEKRINSLVSSLEKLKKEYKIQSYSSSNKHIFVDLGEENINNKIILENGKISIIEIKSSYIVEFKKPPLSERKKQAEEEINNIKEEIKKSEATGDLSRTRTLESNLNTKEKKVEADIVKYKSELEAEHRNSIDDIKRRVASQNILGRTIYDFKTFTGRIVSAITGYNIFSEEEMKEGEFYNVFNGVTLNLSKKDVAEIKKSSYVKNVYPNEEVKALLSDSVPLINADDVWTLGYKGDGMSIAIIDTGIDYTHPDLGGCFGEGCKVVGGYDFVNNDNDPMDDHGHGTHVAGIAAGSANISLGGGGGGSLSGYVTGSVVEDICTDSDKGKNYSVQGTARNPVDRPGYIYEFIDYCFNKTVLYEGYCALSQLVGFVIYNCPVACYDGACVNYVPTPVTQCTNTETGMDPYVFGKIFMPNGYEVVDTCVNSTRLMDYFCYDTYSITGSWFNCENGCIDGACVASGACTDSDVNSTYPDGINYYVKGSCIDNIESTPVNPLWDYCSGNTLAEMRCSGGGVCTTGGSFYNCSSEGKVCSNGACVSGACIPTEVPERTCNDNLDNDCDNLIDCDDTDCKSTPACYVCVPTEVPERTCNDNLDNDCDNLIDCDDADCTNTPACGGVLKPVYPVVFEQDNVQDNRYKSRDDNWYGVNFFYGDGSLYNEDVVIAHLEYVCESCDYALDLSSENIQLRTTAQDATIRALVPTRNEKTITFAHRKYNGIDYDNAILADADGDIIHVREGEFVNKSEYVVVGGYDNPNEGYILEVTNIYNDTATYSGDEIVLEDVFSGITYTATTGPEGKARVTIYGKEYTLNYWANKAIVQDSAFYISLDYPQSAGSEKIVSPKIGLSNGSSIALGTLDNLREAYGLDVSGTEPAVLFEEYVIDMAEKNTFIVPIYNNVVGRTQIPLGKIVSTEKTYGGFGVITPNVTGNLTGVAPNAKLYAYKVLDDSGSGSWSSVIAGIDRATDPNNDGDFSDHVDIISLSLGGSGNPDDPVSRAIDNAVDIGVIATIAAGNSGPDEQSISSPGTARKAITVGATDKDDRIADFSSRGPVIWSNGTIIKPDIVAPGVEICSAQWDSAWDEEKCYDDKHVAISGTSMATPHVAGVAALIKQKYPNLSPDEIKDLIKITAKDLSYNILTQGSGRVNALAAVSSKIVASGNIDFGLMEKGQTTATRKLKIKNLLNEELSLTLSVGTSFGEEGEEIDAVSLSTNSITLAPLSEQEIDVNLNFPIEYDGFFTGKIILNDLTTSYRVVYSFSRYSKLNLEVEGEHYPNFYIHNNDLTKFYSLQQDDTIFGNSGSLLLKSGEYTVYAINDFINPFDPLNYPETDEYILIDTISIPIDSEIDKTFRLSDARKFTVKARTIQGEALGLFEWHKGVAAYKNKFDSCWKFSYTSKDTCENNVEGLYCKWMSDGYCDTKSISINFFDPIYGDREIYLSNKPDNGFDTDIILKYFGGKNE